MQTGENHVAPDLVFVLRCWHERSDSDDGHAWRIRISDLRNQERHYAAGLDAAFESIRRCVEESQRGCS